MIAQLEMGTTPTFEAARECRDLVAAAGLEVPPWNVLSLPSPTEELAELESNQPAAAGGSADGTEVCL